MKRTTLRIDRMVSRGGPVRSQFAPVARKSYDFDPVFLETRSGWDRRIGFDGVATVAEERRAPRQDRRRRDSMQIGDCWWLKRNYLTRELEMIATGELPQTLRLPEAD